MITKNDCLSILVKMEVQGVNVNPQMRKLLVSNDLPIDVLKFIAKNKGIDALNFYEMLRKKHNQKKSHLYRNIVREVDQVDDVIITLSSLLQQIVLFSNKLENPDHFLKEVRAEEITRVLNLYFKDGITADCEALLKLIKADLLVFEYINERRDLKTE